MACRLLAPFPQEWMLAYRPALLVVSQCRPSLMTWQDISLYTEELTAALHAVPLNLEPPTRLTLTDVEELGQGGTNTRLNPVAENHHRCGLVKEAVCAVSALWELMALRHLLTRQQGFSCLWAGVYERCGLALQRVAWTPYRDAASRRHGM